MAKMMPMIQVGDSVVLTMRNSSLDGLVGEVMEVDLDDKLFTYKVQWLRNDPMMAWFSSDQVRLIKKASWDSEAI